MKRSSLIKTIAGGLAVLLAALLIYQIPYVHKQVSWRFQILTAYTGGIIHPADQAPTPEPTIARTPTLAAQLPTSRAFTAVPSPTPTITPTTLPSQVQLAAPEYEVQDINNCGPASLSMYLRYYGWTGSQANIANEIKPIPEDRNVNIEEMAYYVSNFAGWLNVTYRVGEDLDTLRTFLAAGIPVVIEETFHMDEPYWNNDDLWAGHYLLITGYDDATETFTTQDTYYGANKKVAYTEISENWESFNHVLLLVYPPTSQGLVEQILGADWDVDTNRQNALDEAQQATQDDPKDAFAWFNLGSNLVYFDRYDEAADAYDTARSLNLPQRMYRYQFGPFLAYFNANRNADLLALTQYALERTPVSEEALLWNGYALYRDGDTDGARQQFKKALEAHPGYQDALTALELVGDE